VPDSRLRQFIARQQTSPTYMRRWMPSPYKRGVPPQIKKRERAALRRHYQQYAADLSALYGQCCVHCGTDDDKLVIDHILPIAKGGLSQFDNLQLLCAVCNQIKGKLWFDCRPVTDSHI